MKTDEQIEGILNNLAEAIADDDVPVFLSPLLMAARQALIDHVKVWKDPAALQVNLLRTGALSRMNALHIAGATDYDSLKATRDEVIESAAKVCDAASMRPGDCPDLWMEDPETGVRECRSDLRGYDCQCAGKAETAEKLAQDIRALKGGGQ